jgi:phosphotransferase system enzyme I (PtsP)
MKRDNPKIISDSDELAALFTNAANLNALLQNIVEKIATYMDADVCSLYLFDDDTQKLTLKASKGLRSGFIGKVRLKPGEGLAGIAFKELRAVCEGDATKHPAFRPVLGIGDEKYYSFLAIPILRGQNRIGVMTLQSVKKDYFSDEDICCFPLITPRLIRSLSRKPPV